MSTSPPPSGDSVEELQSQVNELSRRLREREALIAIAEAELMQRRAQVDALYLELAERQRAIETILNTRSWKWTEPVRLAGVALRRVLSLCKGKARGANAPASQRSSSESISNLDAEIDLLRLASENILDHSRGMSYVHRGTHHVDVSKLQVRAIAFYQSHVNWPDVVAAVPIFQGHYQPHLPGEFGCYAEVSSGLLRKQAALARQYGIAGFCFSIGEYSSGRVFERVVEDFLAARDIEISFCLRVTGGEGSALPAESLRSAVADPRYIRIDGRPVLILDAGSGVDRWRREAGKQGIGDLFLMAAINEPGPVPPDGFDAVIDLPQIGLRAGALSPVDAAVVSGFGGHAFRYADVFQKQPGNPPSGTQFETVLTQWDNSPSQAQQPVSLIEATPQLYAEWFKECCRRAALRSSEERLVFIYAWNAWSEGAHLEPDRKTGYALLHATANTLRYFHDDPETTQLIESINRRFEKTSDVAIVLHCYHEDLIGGIFKEYLSRVRGADLFVTVRGDVSRRAIEQIHAGFPNVWFLCQENRGRDIRPFLFALRQLRARGYSLACKIHTKKTPNWDRGGGDAWRQKSMQSLLGSSDPVATAKNVFAAEPALGLLAPAGSIVHLGLRHLHIRNVRWLDHLLNRMGRADLVGAYPVDFAAGSMYWFRVQALEGLDNLLLDEDLFEQELGQVDGTLAHAVERLSGVYALQRGYSMREIEVVKANRV